MLDGLLRELEYSQRAGVLDRFVRGLQGVGVLDVLVRGLEYW